MLTLIALIAGPIGAVQVQKFIERATAAKTRKEWVFKTLMATRGAILSFDHVSALNRIDLEFPERKRKYKDVIEAWKEYFQHLCTETKTEDEAKIWVENNDLLLFDLLYKMASSLGYKIDKNVIERRVYSPKAHVKIENENAQIRDKLISLFEGKISLPINVSEVAWNLETTEKQQKLQELLIEYYSKENAKPKSGP